MIKIFRLRFGRIIFNDGKVVLFGRKILVCLVFMINEFIKLIGIIDVVS